MRIQRLTLLPALLIVCLAGPAPQLHAAQALEPIVHTLAFPAPEKNLAEIQATFPAAGRQTVELMMPKWSPGFYRMENYAGKIQEFAAKNPDGKALRVEQPKQNRWLIHTDGAATVVVTYKLLCKTGFVTTNFVGPEYTVLNGPATFLTLVEKGPRPHEVKLELPAKWKLSMTGLEAAPGDKAHHYRAADFDTLIDCPILAGNLGVTDFTVSGSKHYLVTAGDFAQWDAKKATADVEKIVREHERMWGQLPFKKYVFLLVLRGGGGGLEHLNSTLIFSSAAVMRSPASYHSWLALVSHEYFHAFNVKRLRPVELGPFDYEKEARTPSLWVAEGLTSYYGDIIPTRAGLAKPAEFLGRLSSHIDKLQKSPGRLLQTLEQSSNEVWTNSTSGVNANAKTVSYYVKGPVVGFLLDAHIQRATKGAKSLDDVMRLAYKRYSGERGFTPEQFRQTAEEVAGIDLKEWFRKAIASTDELDYAEALDWFGLRFAKADARRLEVNENATDAQKNRLKAWLEPAGK